MGTKLHLGFAVAVACLTAPTVHAQEANTWDVLDLLGRDETTSIAQRSRQEVLAELQRAREEGTYHAGNEGPLPAAVAQRRVLAQQREAERMARGYRDDVERQARVHQQPLDAPAAQMPESGPVLLAPVESVVILPVQPAELPPVETATPQPVDRAAGSSSDGMPEGPAQLRPSEQMAADRRSASDALTADRTSGPAANAGPSTEPGAEPAADAEPALNAQRDTTAGPAASAETGAVATPAPANPTPLR